MYINYYYEITTTTTYYHPPKNTYYTIATLVFTLLVICFLCDISDLNFACFLNPPNYSKMKWWSVSIIIIYWCPLNYYFKKTSHNEFLKRQLERQNSSWSARPPLKKDCIPHASPPDHNSFPQIHSEILFPPTTVDAMMSPILVSITLGCAIQFIIMKWPNKMEKTICNTMKYKRT